MAALNGLADSPALHQNKVLSNESDGDTLGCSVGETDGLAATTAVMSVRPKRCIEQGLFSKVIDAVF